MAQHHATEGRVFRIKSPDLHVIQSGITSIQIHQLAVPSLLCNSAILQHNDLIGVRNR